MSPLLTADVRCTNRLTCADVRCRARLLNWPTLTIATVAVPHGRCCERSEPEDDRAARAAEIELGIPERHPQDVEILERVKVPDIASHANMFSQEDHQAAADVPAEMIVIGLEQRGNVEIDIALDQPEARRKVGLRRPNPRSEQHVTHDGKNARREARRRPKKIFGVPDVKLDADDWAHRAETDTDIQLLVLAPGNLRTPRVAAEVVTDKGAYETLRPRGGGKCET